MKKFLLKIVFSRFFLILLMPLSSFSPDDPKDIRPTPEVSNMLFYLQRDPDANTVVYQLNLKENGELNENNPIRSFWIRYADKGQEKDLSFIEKKFAYGTSIKALGQNNFEVRLVSFKTVPLYLKPGADKTYQVYAYFENKLVVLKKIFVRVKGGSYWVPKVSYIELTGKDPVSGKEMSHRINP